MDSEPARLLRLVTGLSWGERLDGLSAALVGRPYLADPLVGSPTEPERLVTRVDAFDCVTFVETVLALAASATAEELPRRLVDLRYHLGCVSWRARNHYFSDWLGRNAAMGLVRPLTEESWVAERRALSILEGYPLRATVLRWLPAARVRELQVMAGDVVGFVSTRPELDTFHVGLLSPHPSGPLLRHASRDAGAVVEVPLALFLAQNKTPGLLAVRPLPPSPGGPL